jgi:hypothetical protein
MSVKRDTERQIQQYTAFETAGSSSEQSQRKKLYTLYIQCQNLKHLTSSNLPAQIGNQNSQLTAVKVSFEDGSALNHVAGHWKRYLTSLEM